jgi:hypothetical protein
MTLIFNFWLIKTLSKFDTSECDLNSFESGLIRSMFRADKMWANFVQGPTRRIFFADIFFELWCSDGPIWLLTIIQTKFEICSCNFLLEQSKCLVNSKALNIMLFSK